MHSDIKIYDYSYWAINKVYLLSSQNLNELIIPYLLAIRDRNSSWTFFSLKDCEIQEGVNSHITSFVFQELKELSLNVANTPPLTHLPKLILFSFTSNCFFPHGSKTWCSVFISFTSYTISPWKRLTSTLWNTSFKKKGPEGRRDLCAQV